MRNRLQTGFAGPQKEWVEAPTPPFNRRRSLGLDETANAEILG
jgi:hypothetical protein